MYTFQIQSKRPVTTSASLHTQTGLHCLAIQVLNTRVCFIIIWYTSLTSVHYNLGHGLAIVTESFTVLFTKLSAVPKKLPAGTPPRGHSCWQLPLTAYRTFFSGMVEQWNCTSQIMVWLGTVRLAALWMALLVHSIWITQPPLSKSKL